MFQILLVAGFVLTLVLVFLFINLLLRVRSLESKLINFTPTEAYTIMENIRDMVIESSRVADNLEDSIKHKEAILEDLSVLVDEKVARLYNILENNPNERGVKQRVFELHSRGRTIEEIARDLGISVTEVRLAVNMTARR